MSGTGILIIVLVLVVLIGATTLVLRSGRRGTGRDLRRRFGPEYDRVAQRHGDRAAAERELAERVREHDALNLRPLDPGERERFERTWTAVQERFIDDPRGATAQADQLIGGLLTAIGYPSEDREKQLDLASVDHARALGDYRQARELARRALGDADGVGRSEQSAAAGTAAGPAYAGVDEVPRAGAVEPVTRQAATRDGDAASATETLRQALLHYRVMFNDLLDRAGAQPVHAGQR